MCLLLALFITTFIQKIIFRLIYFLKSKIWVTAFQSLSSERPCYIAPETFCRVSFRIPTNIANMNLVMGCSDFFHYSNTCPGILTLWRYENLRASQMSTPSLPLVLPPILMVVIPILVGISLTVLEPSPVISPHCSTMYYPPIVVLHYNVMFTLAVSPFSH